MHYVRILSFRRKPFSINLVLVLFSVNLIYLRLAISRSELRLERCHFKSMNCKNSLKVLLECFYHRLFPLAQYRRRRLQHHHHYRLHPPRPRHWTPAPDLSGRPVYSIHSKWRCFSPKAKKKQINYQSKGSKSHLLM